LAGVPLLLVSKEELRRRFAPGARVGVGDGPDVGVGVVPGRSILKLPFADDESDEAVLTTFSENEYISVGIELAVVTERVIFDDTPGLIEIVGAWGAWEKPPGKVGVIENVEGVQVDESLFVIASIYCFVSPG
jgi:hypothetical protein